MSPVCQSSALVAEKLPLPFAEALLLLTHSFPQFEPPWPVLSEPILRSACTLHSLSFSLLPPACALSTVRAPCSLVLPSSPMLFLSVFLQPVHSSPGAAPPPSLGFSFLLNPCCLGEPR